MLISRPGTMPMHQSKSSLLALAAVICSAISCAPALAADAPSAPLTAGGLLYDCVEPANSPKHAVCMVIVGSVMDGIDVAAIAARKQQKPPSICLPADLDRQSVIDEFIYAMGTGKGAYDNEKASVVLGALLMETAPCT